MNLKNNSFNYAIKPCALMYKWKVVLKNTLTYFYYQNFLYNVIKK